MKPTINEDKALIITAKKICRVWDIVGNSGNSNKNSSVNKNNSGNKSNKKEKRKDIFLVILLFERPTSLIDKELQRSKDKNKSKETISYKFKPLALAYQRIEKVVKDKKEEFIDNGTIIEPFNTKKNFEAMDSEAMFKILGFTLRKLHKGIELRNMELIEQEGKI